MNQAHKIKVMKAFLRRDLRVLSDMVKIIYIEGTLRDSISGWNFKKINGRLKRREETYMELNHII